MLGKMIYFHLLRDHVWHFMKFWHDMAGWGYGVFSSTASEHLNKRLKVFECDHTNQGADIFYRVLHHFRFGMLHFSDTLLHEIATNVKCSSCGAVGHNKNNKVCPNHVGNTAMLQLDLAESDNEDGPG